METACFAKAMQDYEESLEESRKKNRGIFYTDLSLAGRMIEELNMGKNCVLLDPCCGTGSFVAAALAAGYGQVWGADSDEAAVTICKSYTGEKRSVVMDTLGESGDKVLSAVGAAGGADLVIGNPPYAPLSEETILETGDRDFQTRVNEYGGNLFVAALLRAFELAKSGGRISYIIPKNFLHVEGYRKFRSYLLSQKTILSIVDLGVYFKNVRGEQIVLTLRNSPPGDGHELEIKRLENGQFVFRLKVRQDFYENDILLFRGEEDYNVYRKLSRSYLSLGSCPELEIRRGRSRAEEAVRGKNIRKFGYKDRPVPKSGKQIFIQNIYSSESGIIAAFGGNLEAGETVTVIRDGDEEGCKYLLGLLHSRLCNFYLYKYCYNHSTLTMHTDAKYLRKLPVVWAEGESRRRLVRLVGDMERAEYLEKPWLELAEEMNAVIYQIYGLTENEISFVESEIRQIQSKRWFKEHAE